MNPEQFIDLLEKLIEKKLQTKMYHLGTIHQVEGDRASVYIDGSSTPTPNVPYNPNIKFNAGEDVWVVYINFDPKDKFILCKRGTEEPDPPSSGEDMQVHGNEWHTTAFETAAGAQEKVDTHADSKSTHGVGSNYIAKTTNPNQWPLWTEIEDKPSEFTPESHDHNLADLAEKSYNSLTDKPAIPSNPEDIGAEPTFEKKTAFNKDFGATEGTVTEGNDPRLSDAREPLPHEHTKSDITDFDHDHNDIYYTKLQLDNVLNDKADLDGNSKVPLSQLPDVTKQQTYVIPTIADRDDLTNLIEGEKCYVTNDGDSYIWDGSQWLILAQADWENVNLEWVNINNRPSSSVSNIDDAVNKRHTHNNKNALDSISQISIDNWNNKQDAIEGLTQVYSSENSDKFLLYRPSTGDYRSITKEDLLSGLGGTDEYIFRVKRQEFTTTEGQTIFAIDGQYLPNNNRISVYVWGNRQPNTAYEETNSNTITLIDELPAGTKVIIEWFEVVNVMDYIHAESHATDGTDPITPEMIGAVPVVEGKSLSTEDYTTAEKNKLAGVEDEANKYVHPSTHPASIITETSSKRFVSDTEKANWNAKETPSGAQTKADTAEANAKGYTDIHDQNTTKHITATERTNWNDANAKKHTHSNKSILDTITQTLINTWNSAVDHISDAVKHITSAERASWNAKETPAGAQAKADIAEQNAKAYADNKIDDLAGEGRTTETVKEVADDLVSHKANTANPHKVTKSQVGLANVDNVKQASKTEFDSHNNDATRHITAEERTRWNAKQDALGYTPVNKAGDTMTGPLTLTGSIFDTEFKADNWNLINKYTGGGWARGLLNVKNKDGTNYIQIGGIGSGQNFTRLYIGKAWNDWLLGINPNNNTVEIQGNLTKNNKEVATKDEIPTKVSQLENDRGYVTQEELEDAGHGDMLKSVYDTDNDGKVDAAEAADSVPWTGVTGKPSTFPPSSHTHIISNITGLQVALDGKMSVGPLTWNDLKGV